MRMFYNFIIKLFLIAILVQAHSSYGNHLTGGSMRYEFVGQDHLGRSIFRIYADIYRDALSGGADFDNPIYFTIFNMDNNSFRNKRATLFKNNIENIPLNDLGPCALNVPNVCIQKATYSFLDTLQLNNNGYIYSHQRCCRSDKISNLFFPGQQGSTYSVHITRQAILQNNSSPEFIQEPPLLICLGANFEYQFAATDNNGNRLRYYLCSPNIGGHSTGDGIMPTTMSRPPYQNVNYVNNHTPIQPFGPDVEVNLNSETGLLTLRPNRVGIFTIGICIDEFDSNNQLIGTIKRDIQFNIADCIVPSAIIDPPIGVNMKDEGSYATCKGLNNTFVNKSTGAQTYFWDFGVKDRDDDTSRLFNPVFAFPDSGTFEIKLIINKGETCADSVIFNLSVYPVLEVNFDFQTFCEDLPVIFNSTSTSSVDPIVSQSWFQNNNLIDYGENLQHTFPAVGPYPVTLKVETQNGCRDSIIKNIELPLFTSSKFEIITGLQQGQSDTFVVCNENNELRLTNLLPNGVPFIWNIANQPNNDLHPTHIFTDTGTYKIQLIANPNTPCADTSSQWVRMLPTPKADFNFLTYCQKFPVEFNSILHRPYDAITTTNWTFGDGTSSTDQHPEKLFSTVKNYNVSLSITTAAGCKDNITKTIDVHPNPVADFNITGESHQQQYIWCDQLLPIQYNDQSKHAISHDWTFGNQLSTSTSPNPQYIFNTPGDYNVQLIINKGEKCADTIIKPLKVINGISKIDFNLKDICVQTSQTFSNQSVAVKNDFASYLWDFGNGQTSTIRSPQVPYSTAGVYTIKMTATTALGCKDSIEKTITIHPAPTVEFNNNDACLLSPHQIQNNSQIISGQIDQYQWSIGQENISTDKNPSHTFPNSGNFNVTLTATSDYGCISKITKSVHVRPAANVDFDYSNHCFKAPVFFTDQSTSTKNDIIDWIWKLEPGVSKKGKNISHTFTKPGIYNFTLIVVSNIGCQDSITKQVVVEDIPQANFNIAGNDDIQTTLFSCNGDYTVQFSNTSPDGLQYSWEFGWDNNTSSDKNPSFIYPDSGTYTIKLITEKGTVCEDFIEKKVRVLPPVTADFSYTTECVLAPVYFKSISNRKFDPIKSVQWDFGDGTSSTDFNPEKLYSKSGTFNVKLTQTATSGCSATVSKTITILPKPKADFIPDGIASNDKKFLKCENLLGITFKNNSTQNNTNHWEFKDLNTTSTIDSPTHYFSDFGVYPITLIINKGKICGDTITKNIEVVHGIDLVDFTFNNACVNTEISFTDISKTKLNDIDTYYWDFGDFSNSNIKNPKKSYTLPGDYTVKLYITTKNGCIDSIAKNITIYPAPQPLFEVDLACQNDDVFIENNSSISSGNITSYLWNFGNNRTDNNFEPIISYPTPGQYVISLSATSDFGCTHTYRDTIEIRERSQPDFSYINQCVSAPVEFSDQSISKYNDIIAWDWIINPQVSLNTKNPQYTFNDAGTYPITLIISTIAGCRDSVTKDIILKPHPQAEFILDGIKKEDDLYLLCDDNKTISVFNQSIDNQTNHWIFDKFGQSDLVETKFTFPDTGTFQIQLVINKGTLCEDSKTLLLDLLPTLQVDFEHPIICEQNQILFKDLSSIASNDIISRDWYIDSSAAGQGTSLPFTFEKFGLYNIDLIVQTKRGCIDTISKTVKVEALPIVDFNISEVCPQQSTTFPNASQSVEGNTITDYLWKFGDGATSTLTEPSHTYTTPGTYELELLVNTQAGCKDSIKDILIVREFIEPVITIENEVLCREELILFKSENSKGIYQEVFWDFGNGSSSNIQEDKTVYDQGGSYNVELILKDALCGEFMTSQTIYVTSTPQIDLGPDFALCPNLSKEISLGHQLGMDSIFWSTGEINKEQIMIKGTDGRVHVEAFYRGCLLTDTLTITANCEVLAPKVFSPNGDGINDYFNLLPSNIDSYNLSIYNRWGHLVFSTNNLNTSWDGTFQGQLQPVDNYTYYAIGIKVDGTPFNIEGSVLLIR